MLTFACPDQCTHVWVSDFRSVGNSHMRGGQLATGHFPFIKYFNAILASDSEQLDTVEVLICRLDWLFFFFFFVFAS